MSHPQSEPEPDIQGVLDAFKGREGSVDDIDPDDGDGTPTSDSTPDTEDSNSNTDGNSDSGDLHIERHWEPHPGQEQVLESDARFKVIACGRRWGKSELCAHIVVERALNTQDGQIWWVGPTYSECEVGFDLLERIIPDGALDRKKASKPQEFEFREEFGGSRIQFRSAERADGLVGVGLDLLIVDEAAMVPERAWQKELRPTLSDTKGDAIFISTPNGRNWFYDYFQRGQSGDPEHAHIDSWSQSTYQNRHVDDDEIDAAKKELPRRVFRQEYLAEFIDDSGGVFPNPYGHSDDPDSGIVEDYALEDTHGQGPYTMGVDFARHQDYTVVLALDTTGTLVEYERVQAVSWPQIQSLIEDVAHRCNQNCVINVDASRDNKIVSDLHEAGLTINPVTFSPKTKRQLIENLVTRMEQQEIQIPDIPQLISELQVFEYEVTSTGYVSYHAPDNHHDDSVDALALATHTLGYLGSLRERQSFRDEHADDSGMTYL